MFRFLPVATVAIISSVALSACAANLGNPGSVGASVSSHKGSRKECRAMKRQLRKMEANRDIGNDKYDNLLNRYLNKNCYKG